MKEWEPFFAVLAVVVFVAYSISDLGKALGKRLDELDGKLDGLQEKLDEIESNLETERLNKTYVNPIDL
jgi:hypothetical protein